MRVCCSTLFGTKSDHPSEALPELYVMLTNDDWQLTHVKLQVVPLRKCYHRLHIW